MELTSWTPLLVVIVGAVGTLLGSIVTKVIPQKGTAENALIDQQQEEIKRRDEAIEARDRVIEIKDAEILRRINRERVLSDYAEALRMQISNEEGPPPKSWPNMGESK